jgi:ADP-heptose:LPS heptosyltransferase
MPSLRFLARRLTDRAFGTDFDRTMARARGDGRARFLFFWNRGLGDIALGLVPLFRRIRADKPGAAIEVVTREELRSAFEMTGVDAIHVIPRLAREARVELPRACAALGIDLAGFAATFDYPDPNRWLEGRRAEHPPVLAWQPAWDSLAGRFDIPRRKRVIVVHVSTETAGYYGYVKDWPLERWRELFARHADSDTQWVLVGRGAEDTLGGVNVTDLRGATSFPELMSLIRHHCTDLIAPDSGVLTMAYYLDAQFPIDVISLWSDPRQGILLQGCASPNASLRHTSLVAPGEDLHNLSVDAVAAALRH